MGLTMPELVSAVIPTRGRCELAVKAALSALDQSHAQIEVIVVIDGEDRRTRECLEAIEDPRLRVIPLAKNVGGGEARNIGVRFARGEWVAFLDDDDEWLPQKISIQLEAGRRSEAAFPVISSRVIVRTPALDFTGPQRFYRAGMPISEYLFCRKELADGAWAMQTSTLFARREMMLAVPFRTGLKAHQDWDWLLRAARHPQVSFHMIVEPLTIFRVEDGRTSVSRAVDWEFSANWAQEMRRYFTPRAYSFFLATECITRAMKSRAGPSVYAHLVWEFFTQGSPAVRSVVWLTAYVCIPRRLQLRARRLLRKVHIRNWASSETPEKTGRVAGAFTNTTI
jgi:glycosyltransferase involved in cell wall biosynthesis